MADHPTDHRGSDDPPGRVIGAFAAMRRLPSHARRDLLFRVAGAIEREADVLARSIATEAKKPIAFARAEVARAASTFRIASEEATRLGGETIPLDVTPAGERHEGKWERVPRGPVLAIAPFNFPLNLVAHKVAPALACGASVLVKPPPQAPGPAMILARIVSECGAPEGALEVLACTNEEAERLVRDDRFGVLSFTGSDKVGWHLKSIAGKKRVLLELGGNAAAIVHEDCPDRAFAAESIVKGAFGYAGQVCIKVQRLYVHRAIADAFVAGIVSRASALDVLDPMDEACVVGPMIDEANAKRVDAWIDEAIEAGAKPLLRGARKGDRLAPSVLAFEGSGQGTKVVDEEVFGPVLTVHVYDREGDALDMAGATRFGLQAGIFTNALDLVQKAFDSLDVGALIVNDVPTFRVDNMPYGGVRDSGLGREGVRFAMDEMCEKKLLVVMRRGP